LNLNVLRINNENIRFLNEHEIPKGFDEEEMPGSGAAATTSAPSTTTMPPTVSTPQPTTQKYSEDTIRTLMDLGVGRNEAIAALDACNGNAELAANMLFQM
jgi:DNA damage-inducible protein 1